MSMLLIKYRRTSNVSPELIQSHKNFFSGLIHGGTYIRSFIHLFYVSQERGME